jgi:alpha-glucosidase
LHCDPSNEGELAQDDGHRASGAVAARHDAHAWWQRAVIYQIYPLSFQDTDGDGRGDVDGVLARLDHLRWLGVDAIWLGPVYRSPMADFGYDIADFTDVDPAFGTLRDFDRLLSALHRHGLRLIMDFVPNHTSDRHPWFVESQSSRDNRKRDWYVWADPGPDGAPPNNWLSRFGGSAWEWHPATGQYYYHAFLKEQPDLNWRNPDVRAAMADVLRFWMRRGVDGFRIDAAAVLAEDELLRDDPPKPQADERTPPPDRLERVYTNYRPEVLNWLGELRDAADEFSDRVLLGEVDGSGDRIAHFYGRQDRPLLHLPLNYRLHETQWKGSALAEAITAYLALVPDHGWPNWLIGGHDKKRIADVAGPGRERVAAMLLMTLPGTPVLYQGDEIGMKGARASSAQARDPFERRVPGYGLNRDPERAPMQWNGGANAGFTSGAPWLPLAGDHEARNVVEQRDDPRSLLKLYQRLIRLRHEMPMLAVADVRMEIRDDALIAYSCTSGRQQLVVALNLGSKPQVCRPFASGRARLLLSTHLDRQDEMFDAGVPLRAHEGLILLLI